ncbi:energy transducer TonB [Xanthomonas sp. NCPPB 2632]|uniref:energy transducer TonB n=1 Tax=Xanthomonas sp. NCPPB 2632 TaxID=3240912 RepID=UPI003519BD5E
MDSRQRQEYEQKAKIDAEAFARVQRQLDKDRRNREEQSNQSVVPGSIFFGLCIIGFLWYLGESSVKPPRQDGGTSATTDLASSVNVPPSVPTEKSRTASSQALPVTYNDAEKAAPPREVAGATLGPTGASQGEAQAVEVVRAEVLRQATPMYPPQAVRQHHEGTVRLEVSIGTDGRVSEARVLESSGFPELDRSALLAIRSALYSPGRSNGRPVNSTVTVPITFSLNRI